MPLGNPLVRGGPGYPCVLFPLALAGRLMQADEGVGPYGMVFVGADTHILPY